MHGAIMDKALSRKNGVEIKSTVEYIPYADRGITLKLPYGFQMNAHTTLPREPETPACRDARGRRGVVRGERTESGEARVCARDPRPRRARPPRAPAGWGARPVIRPGVAPWPARRGLYKGRELSVLAEERRTRVKATHVDCVCDMREVSTLFTFASLCWSRETESRPQWSD